MTGRFRDRFEAGRVLAQRLAEYANRADVLVLGLPRGGVPVAYEIARELHAPLDVFVVRKLGMPGHEEFAIGAIATGGVRIINEEAVRAFGVTDAEIEAVTAEESVELERRERRYRDSRPPAPVAGQTVILVDDGLATGSTMRAAVEALRQEAPARIIVAVPTAAPETCDDLRAEVDEVVCAMTPEPFYAVGLWYHDFDQTSDEEVHDLLQSAAQVHQGAPGREEATVSPDGSTGEERTVHVEVGSTTLEATLAVPSAARGIVLFAHGSGSSRHSPRNRYVAQTLREGRLATLLLDLLSKEEEAVDIRTRQLRFNIDLLADRLVGATDWLATQPETRDFHVGYFGASTGAGAALVAAAARPDRVDAVVSRGGRPDLAGDSLELVRAPTLLIVGGADELVLDLNEQAMARMERAETSLAIVPGATHLFEEPGALEEVSRMARDWFVRYLHGTVPSHRSPQRDE